MKIKNNHNHSLTKEDLLKLLENTPSNSVDMDALDDFEKEALEGFSLNTTPKNAAQFIEDTDAAISNRVMNDASGSKKRGLVWFSIAASITFIVGLAVLLLQQQSVQTEQQVALNEMPKGDNNANNPSLLSPMKEIANKEEKVNNVTDEFKKSTNLENDKKNLAIISRADALGVAKTSESDDESKNSKDESSEGFADNSNVSNTSTESKNKEEKPKLSEQEDSKPMAGVAATKKSSSSNASTMPSVYTVNKQAVTEARQVNAEVTTATSDYEISRKEDVGSSLNKAITITSAYYKGGTKAIKKFMLNYEKSTPFIKKLKGDFLIKGMVKTNGTFLVLSIVSKNEEFIEYLTTGLNTLKDWEPAKNKNTIIESSVEIKLQF